MLKDKTGPTATYTGGQFVFFTSEIEGCESRVKAENFERYL